MTKKFKDAIKSRRTFYQIDNKSTLSEKELLDLIRFAVEYVPSAFNSQTTRVVLLTGEAHQKLWNIVKNTLRKRISAEAFAKTEQKILLGTESVHFAMNIAIRWDSPIFTIRAV